MSFSLPLLNFYFVFFGKNSRTFPCRLPHPPPSPPFGCFGMCGRVHRGTVMCADFPPSSLPLSPFGGKIDGYGARHSPFAFTFTCHLQRGRGEAANFRHQKELLSIITELAPEELHFGRLWESSSLAFYGPNSGAAEGFKVSVAYFYAHNIESYHHCHFLCNFLLAFYALDDISQGTICKLPTITQEVRLLIKLSDSTPNGGDVSRLQSSDIIMGKLQWKNCENSVDGFFISSGLKSNRFCHGNPFIIWGKAKPLQLLI